MNVRTAIVAFFTACGIALIAQDDPQVPLRDGEREVASGNYAAAAVHMRAALNIVGGVVSEPALMRSVILRTAEVESLAGNFDEADKLVRTLQQFEGASTEDTVRAQTVLARCERELGNLRAATTAASEAVNLALAHSDLNVDWTLNAFAELAEIRRMDGNFAEARRLTASFGSANMASPRLSAAALAAPAQIAWSDGHVADAPRLAETVLATRTRARPADHPDLLVLRELLARVALGEGRLQDAAQFLNGLSEAARLRLGASHPFTIDSQLTEASYYARRAAYNESETRLDQATTAAARLPANSLVRLRMTEMRVIVALGLHRSVDADSAAAQAAQFAAKDRADAPQMAAVLNIQAAAAIDQRKFSDARTLLQNADSILASRAAETQADRMDTLMYSGLLAAAGGDGRKAVDTLGKWVNLRGPQANDEPEAVVLRTLARSAMLQKEYAQAANSFTRALAIRSDIGGLPDQELSSDYLDLGTALKSSNKLPEAVTAFRRALDLRERPGEARPESLPVYTALADTLLTERKPSEALPYLETRLRLVDPSGLARSDDTLRLADQVSRLEFSEGRYQQAEPLLRRLYDAALAGQGPAAQDRAELLARLGDVETKLNRNGEAVRFLDELSRIDLLRKKLPEASEAAEQAAEAGKKSTSPLSIASSLNALADIRVAQGKLDDAAGLYEQARSTEGADSRARAISLNGLGRIALNKKQWNDADTLLNQALEAVRTDSNPSPGLEALVVANLAASQLAADHADRATELYTRFLALEPLSHPPEDPPLLEQLDELARFYSVRNRRSQDVLDVYNRVLRSSQLVFGDQSDEFAWALFNEAEFYRNQKQYNDAAPLYERSAGLFRARYGDQSDEMRNVTGSLSDVYRAEGRPQDAIQLLEPLVSSGASGDASVLQGDLLDRLAGLYRQTGNQAEAIRIYENLANTYAAQAPAFQNSKWLEATKNLIAANVEAKKAKEATALYDKAVVRIHTSARKDTPSEVNLMHAYSAVLRKQNRAKEADSIENKAKRIEQNLGGR
jgi:hypothetical protein